MERVEYYAPIELELKNRFKRIPVSKEELVSLFQDSVLGDIVSVQLVGLTSASEQTKSSSDLARGRLSIHTQPSEGGWVECFSTENCSETHAVNVSPKNIGFLDASEQLAPGIESVIRLLLRQDLMNPFYLWLKNYMDIGLTNSGKGDVGYKQDLACFDTDHCCFSAEVDYDQVADSLGRKMDIPTSKIRLVVFLKRNDGLWKPEKLDIQYDLHVKEKKEKDFFGRKKKKKKKEVGVSHSTLDIRKPKKALHMRSQSLDELASCRVMTLPKENCAQWVGDGLFLTNLSQSRIKDFVAAEASLIEYKELLESKMMAQKLAVDSVERVIIPHGYQIADRLSKLHKYYPGGEKFSQWLDDIRNKYPTGFQEFESKLVSQSKNLWERTFQVASKDYEVHRYKDDLAEQGGEVSVNLPRSECLESFEEVVAFIRIRQQANIRIRGLVKELKAFESRASGSQHLDVIDDLLTIARLKCDVVEAVNSYREPYGKSPSVPQKPVSIPQDVMDVVSVINNDSSAGSKLCDLLIKKTFAVIARKAGLHDKEWFIEVCWAIEAVNSSNNNYKQLAKDLRECCLGALGTTV
ncbi:hypothetical protein GV64_19115 [Endozoicomonas elysicola]|uniref:Uncharacterized protein n=2 Tax=Endozoicomonas elysicola TaxID=305900 RepID=A0A081KEI2_9GAMM|nr:hypothetical protein GV64_19115 [Endozoicomonas elysicola]